MAKTWTRENLARVAPSALRARLEQAGFRAGETLRGGRALLMAHPDGVDLLLPLDPSVADYPTRAADVVVALSEILDVERVDLLRELLGETR